MSGLETKTKTVHIGLKMMIKSLYTIPEGGTLNNRQKYNRQETVKFT